MAYAGCVSGRNCCQCDPILTDNFDRADSADLGSNWTQIVEGGEILEGKLQTTGPCLIKVTYPPFIGPGITIDSVNYYGSTKVSIKWTPLDNAIPSRHRLHLGTMDSFTYGDVVSQSIFVELSGGWTGGPGPSVTMRLGYVAGATDVWLTDELPIGWDDGPFYTSSETPSETDKYFDVSLCWEAEDLYTTFRGGMLVRATISSYTGAHYTLEGHVPGQVVVSYAFIESIDNARWDDFSWTKTTPDFPKCPTCLQCLFAADMTTPEDQGIQPYTYSGGTLTRNLTTGAIEITSTTATWRVDLPARSSLSLNYDADWTGASPTFDVEIGPVKLQISKTLTPEQVIAVTINGSGASSIYTTLDNSTLSVCFLNNRVVVTAGGSTMDYETTDATGYVNLAMTAGSNMVSVTEIRATRSDDYSIAALGCEPCNLVTSPCVICSPDEFTPYGLLYVDANVTVVPDLPIRALYATGTGPFTNLSAINAVGPCTPGWTSPEFPPGVPTYYEVLYDTCSGGAVVPGDVVADQDGTSSHGPIDLPRLPAYDPIGGSSYNYAACSWIYYDQLCQCSSSTDPSDLSKKPIASYTVNVTVFKVDGATNKFYLAARLTFDDAVCPPSTPAVATTPLYYRCSGGVAVGLGTNRISYVDYFSELFEINETNCAKTDFTLTTSDDGTYDIDIGTISYPPTLSIHVPR